PLAATVRQLHDTVPALRLAQYTPQRRRALALQVAGDDAVGRDHEVLDELLGAIVLVGLKVKKPRPFEYGLTLERRESERPLLLSHALEPLRHAVLDAQLL